MHVVERAAHITQKAISLRSQIIITDVSQDPLIQICPCTMSVTAIGQFVIMYFILAHQQRCKCKIGFESKNNVGLQQQENISPLPPSKIFLSTASICALPP